MIGVSSKLTEPRIRELLAGAGIDIDRLDRDLAANAKAIDAILARNNDQAEAFGFRGTPSFIVGKFRVPGALSMAEFEQVIADARKARIELARDQRKKRPRRGRGRSIEFDDRSGYFDEIFTQSSWARAFSAFRSLAATSQFTMVRLAEATWPLATLDVCIES